MKCKICLLTDDIVKFEGDTCEYCKMHQRLESEYDPSHLHKMIEKVKTQKGRYNCLIGISGGFDSAMLLHLATEWGLKPYVMHFDNGYNTPIAKHNMEVLEKKTGHIIHYFTMNPNEEAQYKKLCYALLRSGTPDADIANDMIMTDLMYSTAKKLNIKYILNGHNFRTEGSTPIKFTYMDAKYIKSIFKRFYKERLTLPIFTFTDQIMYSMSGIKQIRPFYYRDVCPEQDKKFLIEKYGLKDYGDKHAENTYTHYVGGYLLPKKFKIDKSTVYNSARIRSGYKTTTTKPVPDEIIEQMKTEYPGHFNTKIHPREAYKRYNFKLYKPIIWILVKINALPYTFYKKYCH